MHPHLINYQLMEIPLRENMVVEGKTLDLNPECLRDTYLMEDFIRRGIQGEELAELNRCQIYLKVICLSDLATVDGRSISPTFWHGKPSLMKPQYKWLPQPRPHQRALGKLAISPPYHLQPIKKTSLTQSSTIAREWRCPGLKLSHKMTPERS